MAPTADLAVWSLDLMVLIQRRGNADSMMLMYGMLIPLCYLIGAESGLPDANSDARNLDFIMLTQWRAIWIPWC